MVSLRQNIKFLKTCEKRLHKHITAVLFKKRSKKHLIFENWDAFENRQKWPLCKGYSLCKMVSLRQNIKFLKTCEKRLHKHITAVLFKKRSKKHLIFENWDAFENRQKWPLCKGYSLCKMVTLRQNIKLPQTCVKRLCKHITFVLCKRRLETTANIWKIGRFGKLQKWPLRKGYSLCKMPSLAQTLKLPKTCVKRLHKHITAVLFKTRSKKQLIFEKWDDFENRQKWPLCKGYSLCKMVSLRQKIKLLKTTPQAHHRCSFQKTIEKTPNIRKMRRFWKSAKMATMQRL